MVEEIYILIDTLTPQIVTWKKKFLTKNGESGGEMSLEETGEPVGYGFSR